MTSRERARVYGNAALDTLAVIALYAMAAGVPFTARTWWAAIAVTLIVAGIAVVIKDGE